MTNKPMLSVERLLTEIRQSCELSKSRDAQIDAALVELRALLDKQSCGACGGCDNGCKLDRESPQVEPAAPHQGEPVAVVDLCKAAFDAAYIKRGVLVASAYETIPVGTKLYAEQPSPVAVAHTMRSVMEITQEASQFYVPGTSNWCGHIAKRLNGVKP